MSWKEVCIINFENACRGLINFHRFSANKAIKQLSKESGIPVPTLWKWWAKIEMERELKNSINNDNVSEDVENKEKNCGDDFIREPEKDWACKSCGRSDVSPALNGSNKPYGPNSKFHNICLPCKRQSQHSKDRSNQVENDSDGYWQVCPHCSTGFMTPRKKIISDVKKWEKEGNLNG